MTVVSFIFYLHRKHLSKEGQKATSAFFAYVAALLLQKSVTLLIRSPRKASSCPAQSSSCDNGVYGVIIDPVDPIVYGGKQNLGKFASEKVFRCVVLNVGIRSFISVEQEWHRRCARAADCVLVPHWMTLLPFRFQFLRLKEPQRFQLWVFFSFLSPPDRAFIPLWRQ